MIKTGDEITFETATNFSEDTIATLVRFPQEMVTFSAATHSIGSVSIKEDFVGSTRTRKPPLIPSVYHFPKVIIHHSFGMKPVDRRKWDRLISSSKD